MFRCAFSFNRRALPVPLFLISVVFPAGGAPAFGAVLALGAPEPPGGNIGRGGHRRRSVRQVWRDGRRFLGKPAPRDSPAAFVANSLFFQKQIQIELFLAA